MEIKKEVKIILTKEELDEINKINPVSVCKRKDCINKLYCMGCQEQMNWERSVKPFKDISEIWKYIVAKDNLKRLEVEITELENERNKYKQDLNEFIEQINIL